MLRHTDGRGINTSQRNRPTQFNMFRKPLAVATNLKTGNPMDAQRIVQNCVLKNQSTVIEEMIRANLISEEYLYPFADDVMEWWLIDSWLAERLKEQGEVIIEEYGCYWWGRQSSGQAIYMDYVIQRICGGID